MSITKTKVSKDIIRKMVKKGFGDNSKVNNIIELTDGCFNSAYMVTLGNDRKTVLKVSPRKDIKLMRYEKNIMDTEVSVLKKAGNIDGIPVPEILYYDNSRELIDSDFFFMDYVFGSPLNKIKDDLSEESYKKISSDLGIIAKKINMIEGDKFGNISQKENQFAKWSDSFLKMIDDLLKDAEDVGVSFLYENSVIRKKVAKYRDILDQVKKPALVHKDLWEGNIFVDSKTNEITGIVDCERALYGDPLMDTVCGFLLGNKEFMNEHMGKEEFSDDEQKRVHLYKIYLYLIMVIEHEYRKYDETFIRDWANGELEKELKSLMEDLSL